MSTKEEKETSLVIRGMKEDDGEQVKECQERNLPERYPNVIWPNIIKANSPTSFVLECDGKICGFLIATKSQISSFAIDETFRRQGWGTKIMELFLENKSVVYLQVRESNKIARQFYEKNGFGQIFVLQNYYADENGLYMRYTYKKK